MAENKFCPVCHTINAPTAVSCSECGYRFDSGAKLTESDLQRAARRRKLRSAAASAVIFAILLSLVIATMARGMRFGGVVILIWLAVLVLAIIVIYAVSKITKFRDRRRDREREREDGGR